MLEKRKHRKDYYSINSIISDAKKEIGRDDVTPKDVLEYMIGNSDDWTGGKFAVYEYSECLKRSFVNRLNMLWVCPLFFLSIPIQFLVYGSLGLKRNSMVGKVVHWLVVLD